MLDGKNKMSNAYTLDVFVKCIKILALARGFPRVKFGVNIDIIYI